jgi:ubiquinone/menaquinone biosynthesis C-methylase UbiE
MRNVKEIWDAVSKENLWARVFGYTTSHLNENHLEKVASFTIINKVQRPKAETLVDCGCAFCAYDVYWNSIKQIVAVDVSTEGIRRAKNRIRKFGTQNIQVVVADIRALPLKDKMSDATVSLGVLKHIPGNPLSTYQAIKEIIRITKSGGRVYVNDLDNILNIEVLAYYTAIFLYKKIGGFATGTAGCFPWQLYEYVNHFNPKNLVLGGRGWRLPFLDIPNRVLPKGFKRRFEQCFYHSYFNPSRLHESRIGLTTFASFEFSLTVNTADAEKVKS